MQTCRVSSGENKMNEDKHILGITGGVGAGKSTVLAYLQEAYGADILECDRLAAQLQQRGGPCYEPMLALFGTDVLCPDGEFDRARIAGLVFEQPALLDALNAIVHPEVKSAATRWTAAHERELVVIEAALLLEGSYQTLCDEIWYVYAPEEIRIRRLMESRGYSREKALSIMYAQKPDDFFRRHTQLTIDNSAEEACTYRQIDEGLKTHGFLHNCQREQR